MTDQKNKPPFLMLQRNSTTEELLQKPDCFVLLTQIALRARRSDDFNLHNLEIGESFIGDYQRAGLTEQRYRTAKNNLARWGFATFRATNKGTIAKLTDARVYDINKNEINEQTNRLATDKLTDEQRTTNEQLTTNNNIIIKEDNNIIDVEFEKFWQSYNPIHTGKGVKQEAKTQFAKALKKDTLENITKGLKDYMSECHTKGTFTKQVDGWLKKQMWKGEYSKEAKQNNEALRATINEMVGKDLIDKIEVNDGKTKIYFKSETQFKELKNQSEDTKKRIKDTITTKTGTTAFEFKF